MKKYTRSVFQILILMLLLSGVTACGKKLQLYTVSGFYFDTFVSLTLYEDTQEAKEAAQSFLASCERYDRLFSKTDPASDIWRINHSEGETIEVSEETIDLLQQALWYYECSETAANPCIGAVSSLWEFHQAGEEGRIPADPDLQHALQHMDPYSLRVENTTITRMDDEVQLDLGYIAKGYIADLLKEELQAKGIRSGIINLGGNVVVLDEKPDGQPYTVGIEKPFAQGTPLYTIQVSDTSVVTSGVYERYFYEDGKLYHHILDPATGYSVSNGLNSVTILCRDSAAADALATACFVLGEDKGMQLIEETDGAEALFLDTDLMPHTSSGFPKLTPVK